MKKYPYVFDQTEKIWYIGEAIKSVKCPFCGAEMGFHCVSESENKVWPPHSQRLAAKASKPFVA